jgi:hypothetical protein
VLMQPEAQQQTPAPAGNTNPDFNFIFNGDQKPRRHFNLPGASSPIKLALIIIGGGAVIGILIIILSGILSPKVNTKEILDVAAQAQEISRVSAAVSDKSRDLNTANLASTTSTTLNSQEAELISYLKRNKKKANPKNLAIYLSKQTDSEAETANQNNRLSEYYYSYLKKNLVQYEASIKTAYDTASGANLRSTLQDYSKSTKVILSAQQLAIN